MIQKILFDLDGTLTDPKEGITKSVQYALHHYGIEEPDLEKLTPFIGPPLGGSFMEFYGFSEEKAKEAIDVYRQRFQKVGLFENFVYDGIPQMLEKLMNKGVKLGVASSKPQVSVIRILEHFDLMKYFDVVVGSELDGRRTNKDEVIEEALSQLASSEGNPKEGVLMVGDRKFDVLGAHEMGLPCVGVRYGYEVGDELREAGADFLADTVSDLTKLLLSLV